MESDQSDNVQRLRNWVEQRQPESKLDQLLADDVIFRSPVLAEPKPGQDETKRFMLAGRSGLGNDSFKYVHVFGGADRAVLEFEMQWGELLVNGAQFVEWNEAGQIKSFKVMMRPLKALELLYAHMRSTLNPDHS